MKNVGDELNQDFVGENLERSLASATQTVFKNTLRDLQVRTPCAAN